MIDWRANDGLSFDVSLECDLDEHLRGSFDDDFVDVNGQSTVGYFFMYLQYAARYASCSISGATNSLSVLLLESRNVRDCFLHAFEHAEGQFGYITIEDNYFDLLRPRTELSQDIRRIEELPLDDRVIELRAKVFPEVES